MPTTTDTAICIRCWDFSETSQTVSLFAREQGVMRGLAKGAKREKGPFSGGLDVLTRGEVVVIIKPGRDMATITAWHLQDLYPAVRKNLAANRAALYMADLVHHMLIEHDPHPALFDALAHSLEALENPALIDETLLRWQWNLLVETGYRPELHRDAQTGAPLPDDAEVLAFSAAAGGVVIDAPSTTSPAPRSAAPVSRWRVRRETIEVLRRLDDSELRDSDRDAIQRANRLLATYFREIIGSEPPAMRWAFGDALQ